MNFASSSWLLSVAQVSPSFPYSASLAGERGGDGIPPFTSRRLVLGLRWNKLHILVLGHARSPPPLASRLLSVIAHQTSCRCLHLSKQDELCHSIPSLFPYRYSCQRQGRLSIGCRLPGFIPFDHVGAWIWLLLRPFYSPWWGRNRLLKSNNPHHLLEVVGGAASGGFPLPRKYGAKGIDQCMVTEVIHFFRFRSSIFFMFKYFLNLLIVF